MEQFPLISWWPKISNPRDMPNFSLPPLKYSCKYIIVWAGGYFTFLTKNLSSLRNQSSLLILMMECWKKIYSYAVKILCAFFYADGTLLKRWNFLKQIFSSRLPYSVKWQLVAEIFMAVSAWITQGSNVIVQGYHGEERNIKHSIFSQFFEAIVLWILYPKDLFG